MSTEITTELFCMLVRGNLEIWVNAEQKEALEDEINNPENRFLNVRKQLINVNSIDGIFTAEMMDERKKRMNGQWKCRNGYWHDRGERCMHKAVVGYEKFTTAEGQEINKPIYETQV